MATIFQTRRFWIGFSLISAALFIYSWHFFPKALAVLQLNITMDRQQAIDAAKTLAHDQGWTPHNAHTSASFDTDSSAKTFIELAGGGQEVFRQMIEKEWYMPYQWHVRLFDEFVTQETHIFFTPSGTPYGFRYIIAEDDHRPSISTEEAEKLALTTAQQIWHIDFSSYVLFETANKRQPNGRVDHTFIYQRTDRDLNDGKYRLKIRVSGDQVTQLQPYIYVPQEFLLRYQEMRSANNTIASVASTCAYIFYIFLGAILALFLLIRTGFVIWSTPIKWALFIAVGSFLSDLNNIPLSWMQYQTHTPMQGFLLNLIANACYSMFIYFILIALIFVVAESLTRRALGNVIQLWRSWDVGIANSYTILGYTAGGYLLVGIFLAFVVTFYYATSTYLHWWAPIDTLADPNILATYIPWLTPLITALRAGFLEECKFRAIPLAGAVLLGKRFGHQRIWIIVACFIQALIFSGAHASYPSLPAYARLVELIIPSYMFAGIYLRFGLLPGVICHYVYDAILMALPIFVAYTSFAWLYKIIAIVCILLPLIVLIYRRMHVRAWVHAPHDARNDAWQPSTTLDNLKNKRTSMLVMESNKKLEYIWSASIIASILAWFMFSSFTQDAPPLHIDRQEAVELAQSALSNTYPAFNEQVSTLSSAATVITHKEMYTGDSRALLQHKYVWQTYGKQTYHDLIGSFLYPPLWYVRFLQYNGNVIDRAHSFDAIIGATGFTPPITYAPLSLSYNIPDQLAGATLSERDARAIADHALVDKGIDLTTTTLVSAVATKHPERQDWTFTYAHTPVLPHEQARTEVLVHGDVVHKIVQYIHVPEVWRREQAKHESTATALTILMHLLLRMLFIAGTVYGLLQWAYRRIAARTFLAKFIVFILINVMNMANNLPQVFAYFNTQEPFFNQMLMFINGSFFQLLLRCGIFAFVGSLFMIYRPQYRYKTERTRMFGGIAAGCIIVAVTAILGYFKPNVEPNWATYTALNGWSTIVAYALGQVIEFILTCMSYALVYAILNALSHYNNRFKPVMYIICIIGGLINYGMHPIDSISYWLIAGTVLGTTFFILWYTFMRYAYSGIFAAVGVQIVAKILQQVWYNPFSDISTAAALSIIMIRVITTLWLKEYEKNVAHETTAIDL